MAEYLFANKNGEIVAEEYDWKSLSADQVLTSLQAAFELFPYEVVINRVTDDVFHVFYPNGDGFKDIYICAKGVTPGGRAGLMDEQRIQPKARYLNYVFDRHSEGKKGVFLGVYIRDGQTVFCTWTINHSSATDETPISKQIKIDSIAKAIREGFVQQDKGRGEYACAFKPEFLYFYLRNSDWLHSGVVTELSEHTKPESNDIEMGNHGFLTPEWFNEKGKPFLYLDDEAKIEREKFLKKYAPDVLKTLEGITLLRTIFLNNENKDNLCYDLEFNTKLREIFGSIKSGTAYKYGLHYSQKHEKWATGSGRPPKFLSISEAIELGTQIRDYLVEGAAIIEKYDEISDLEEYRKLYRELNEATDGYVNRIWFLKYYQMLAPKLFPPIYSYVAQARVLKAIGEKADDNPIVRMGQMQLFVHKCDVSSVVFSRTFWANYDGNGVMEEDEDNETTVMPICLATGLQSEFPRNRILFGAPGTGKSYSLNQEAKRLIGENESNYERVTFHPDYSYANFVGAYKPVQCVDNDGNDAITYEYVPGPFMRVYVNALKNSQTDDIKPYLLVIEEINRANVAAVFGDVFQLLDRGDDSVSEYPIQASEDIKKYLARELGGQPEDYSKIQIPDNMFIWATMNSADQGVFPMDTAFKRRWDFTYLGIDESEAGIKGKKVVLGTGDDSRIVEWNELRKAINGELLTYKINEDKLLGPYFISKKVLSGDGDIDSKEFNRIFKNKVIMYLFDDAAKQKRLTLFSGCEDQSRNQYSKICEEFETKGVNIFCESVRSKFTDRPKDRTE